ncbi:DNA-binding protein [Mycobacterium sp. PS03-16]|nr:DNA-binding protein [Mycobacterium sp. PS03-16]
MGAPSERWLIEKLRAGAFPGRKVGRHWRMTEEDIVDALAACSNEVCRVPAAAIPARSGLTSTSRKRVMGL